VNASFPLIRPRLLGLQPFNVSSDKWSNGENALELRALNPNCALVGTSLKS
jgi:hypothetical protein